MKDDDLILIDLLDMPWDKLEELSLERVEHPII